jgi:hypothetical protein
MSPTPAQRKPIFDDRIVNLTDLNLARRHESQRVVGRSCRSVDDARQAVAPSTIPTFVLSIVSMNFRWPILASWCRHDEALSLLARSQST